MHHKVILVFIILLVLIVGGLIFFNAYPQIIDSTESEEVTVGDKQETTTGDTQETVVRTSEGVEKTEFVSHTVVYTTEGFSPEVIEIQKGDAVKFVNESGDDMWVASAIHPIHSLYPQKSSNDCSESSFDACGVIPEGESWSFTFNESGEWRYHNHVRANERGTITVQTP